MVFLATLLVSSLLASTSIAFPSDSPLDVTSLVDRVAPANSSFDDTTEILTTFPSDSFPLSARDEGWTGATVGLMLERDVAETSGKMIKRGKPAFAGPVTRDLFSEEGLGKMVKRGTDASFKAFITWYTGADLVNPYCAQGTGGTPTDNSMIAAVTEEWGSSRPACGAYL